MPDHTTDWQIVREALEQAPCAVTWCGNDHPCSRCVALAVLDAERSADYFRGVADALDVLRHIDFPLTERVDLVAEALAPCPVCGDGREDDCGHPECPIARPDGAA